MKKIYYFKFNYFKNSKGKRTFNLKIIIIIS